MSGGGEVGTINDTNTVIPGNSHLNLLKVRELEVRRNEDLSAIHTQPTGPGQGGSCDTEADELSKPCVAGHRGACRKPFKRNGSYDL